MYVDSVNYRTNLNPQKLINQPSGLNKIKIVQYLLLTGILFTTALLVFVDPVEARLAENNEVTLSIDIGDMCLDFQCYDEKVEILEPLSKADQRSLSLLIGTQMESAIEAVEKAARKYDVPVGLFTGIAFAESSVHENYYLESDKDKCHNPWGLKPSTGVRQDGSYLICFDSWDESTEYFGKLLNRGYLTRGARTVEIIAPYYKCGGPDGADWCLATKDNWIRNVRTFSYF